MARSCRAATILRRSLLLQQPIYSIQRSTSLFSTDASVVGAGDADLGAWKDLLDNSEKWEDCRRYKLTGKVHAKHPDFIRKDRSLFLWLNNAPISVLPKLSDSDFSGSAPDLNNQAAKQAQTINEEQSWKKLVQNPTEWWDNRLKKINVKDPDFTNKETNEALWVSSAPAWVLSKLSPPVAKTGLGDKVKETLVQMSGKQEQSWKDLVENPDKWWDNRLTKRNQRAPDFRHRESGKGLWLNDAPAWVLSRLPCLTGVSDSRDETQETMNQNRGEQKWKEMVENPDKWWDNRLDKGSETSPDFKHKQTGEVLWLYSAPVWVLSKWPPLKGVSDLGDERKDIVFQKIVEPLWKELVENPDRWLDNRLIKHSERAPDFKHLETGVCLWLDSAPAWVLTQLPPLKAQRSYELETKESFSPITRKREEAWNEMVGNLDKWWDQRLRKRSEKHPDFKHKETGEGLWLDSAPAWVLPKLPPSKAEDCLSPGNNNVEELRLY